MNINGCVARLLALIAIAAIPALSRADDSTHVGVAVTAGLSGLGADVGVNLNEYLGLRGTIADISVSHNGNYGTDVNWDGNLKPFQGGVLFDVFPSASGFHVTGGIVREGNKITLNGQPSGGSYTFNGNTYPASDVAAAAAIVDWSKTVPYVGVGWGNLAGSRGLHVTSDLGLLVTAGPTSTIAVTCAAGLAAARPARNSRTTRWPIRPPCRTTCAISSSGRCFASALASPSEPLPQRGAGEAPG